MTGSIRSTTSTARAPRGSGRFRLLLLMAVLALVAAACGGEPAAETGEPQAAETGAAEGGEGTEAAAEGDGSGEMDTVSVGITSLHTWYWWIMAAQAEGLFEPYNIQLDVVPVSSTSQLASALVGESLHFVHVAPATIFDLQNQEPDVKLVAATLVQNPYTMVVTPEINSVTDLQGGVLGVTTIGSSADYFTCRNLLLTHGLELDVDYTAVNTGPTAQRAAAMLAGEIQAACNFEPSLLQLVDEGMKTLESAADYPEFQDVHVIPLNAKESWYSANRDVAVRFMQGYLDSLDWINDPANKERAIELLAEAMEVSQEHATATYERFVEELDAFSKDGLITEEGLAKTIENAEAAGIEGLPEAGEDLSGRYDNSLIEEAAAAR